MKLYRNLMILLLAVFVAGALEAQSPLNAIARSRKGVGGATRISADKLEFDYKDYVALFEGNVKIADPQFELTANKMLIFFENTNDVRRIDAVGNVRVVSEDRMATCGKATYIRATGAVEMLEQPVVRKGRNTLRGRKITIWVNDNRVEVEGTVQLEGMKGS